MIEKVDFLWWFIKSTGLIPEMFIFDFYLFCFFFFKKLPGQNSQFQMLVCRRIPSISRLQNVISSQLSASTSTSSTVDPQQVQLFIFSQASFNTTNSSWGRSIQRFGGRLEWRARSLQGAALAQSTPSPLDREQFKEGWKINIMALKISQS